MAATAGPPLCTEQVLVFAVVITARGLMRMPLIICKAECTSQAIDSLARRTHH